MKNNGKNKRVLEDLQVNIKMKLSALWGVLMLIYIYVDIFGFYKPGVIQGIIEGKVWQFEITQAWAFGALVLMLVPSLMVFLSLSLKAAVNRWVNIIAGAVYIVVGIGTTIGETWAFYIVGHIVGIVLLALIIWQAIKWPGIED